VGTRRKRSDLALPGLAKPAAATRGPAERKALADLRALHRADALIPNAAAVEDAYRRLGRAIDLADAADEGGRVGYLAGVLTKTHAYMTGGGLDVPVAGPDPFGLSVPVLDPEFG
jgi:hypothetical protein